MKLNASAPKEIDPMEMEEAACPGGRWIKLNPKLWGGVADEAWWLADGRKKQPGTHLFGHASKV